MLYLINNTQRQQFNLVFIDPHFRQGLAQKCCDLLTENDWLSKNALIYVEVESEMSALQTPSNWLLLKEKAAGQVFCRLYELQ